MCIKATEAEPCQLCHVSDYFKIQEMCDKAVRKGPFPLQYVSDWFVTRQQVKIQHEDSEYHDKDRLIEWYDGYKKRRALKMLIEKELMPIAWYPSRLRD